MYKQVDATYFDRWPKNVVFCKESCSYEASNYDTWWVRQLWHVTKCAIMARGWVTKFWHMITYSKYTTCIVVRVREYITLLTVYMQWQHRRQIIVSVLEKFLANGVCGVCIYNINSSILCAVRGSWTYRISAWFYALCMKNDGSHEIHISFPFWNKFA